MQLTGLTLRIALVQGLRDGLTNKIASRLDGIPRGNGVRLQHALFVADPKGSTLFTDLSTISSVSMVMRAGVATGNFILQKTVARAAFETPGMTWEQWDANTHQQLTITLSPEDTNQAMAAGTEALPIYLAWEAMLASGAPVFLGSLRTTIYEEGIGTAGVPTAGDPLYYTAAEADARFAALASGAAVLAADAAGVDGPGKYFVDADGMWVWSPARAARGLLQLNFPG